MTPLETSSASIPTQAKLNARAGSKDLLNPTVEDIVAVGTDAILESPHISDGPGRIANAPVPSVFRDDRGTIDRLRVGGKRINLLYSKEGVMRSGYFHPITKNDFVISGEIEVWILTPEGTEKKIYKSRDRFLIPAYTPHILHFLEDSVIAESWDHLGEIRCWLYHPYRRIVDVQNSLISTSIGEHHILVPQNHHDQHQPSAFASFLSGIGGMFWLGTGIAIGVYVGSALSKPR